MIIWPHAEGRDTTGRGAQAVCSRNLATLAREAGAATLTDLAREHTEWAIGNLRDIAGDTKQSGPARVAATNALLDRGHGRPPQLTALAGALDLVQPRRAKTARRSPARSTVPPLHGRLRPGDGQGRDRAGRGRLEEPRHGAALGRSPRPPFESKPITTH